QHGIAIEADVASAALGARSACLDLAEEGERPGGGELDVAAVPVGPAAAGGDARAGAFGGDRRAVEIDEPAVAAARVVAAGAAVGTQLTLHGDGARGIERDLAAHATAGGGVDVEHGDGADGQRAAATQVDAAAVAAACGDVT